MDCLLTHGPTRGIVVGHYSEASPDVHDLLALAAAGIARRTWRLAGARSFEEMRGYTMQQVRRRFGVACGIAMARHRLRRVPFIGVPRGTVDVARDAWRRQRARGHQGGDGMRPEDFYGYQQRLPIPDDG